MTDDTPGESAAGPVEDRTENRLRVPTVGGRALLLVVAVLAVLHADGLFGVDSDARLLFGWLPVHLGYHLALSLLHVGVLVVVYYNWPIWSARPAFTEDGTGGDDGS